MRYLAALPSALLACAPASHNAPDNLRLGTYCVTGAAELVAGPAEEWNQALGWTAFYLARCPTGAFAVAVTTAPDSRGRVALDCAGARYRVELPHEAARVDVLRALGAVLTGSARASAGAITAEDVDAVLRAPEPCAEHR